MNSHTAPAVPHCVITRPSGRRLLRITTGALWALAGALQLQSFMFTRSFAEDVFGTAAASQPAPLGWAIRTFGDAVAAHPAAWNWVFAGAELVIGAALIGLPRGRALRVACWASVAFGAGVWVLGEGVGGLLNGTAALSTGAPGAALLYVVLTVLSWPADRRPDDRLDRGLVRASWAAVWTLGAALVFLPAQWGAHGLAGQAAMGWMMSPHWTVGPTLALTRTLDGLGATASVAISLAMAAVFLAIGLSPYLQRTLAGIGMALALGFWVFAQGFGGLSTGTATDVGSAPVLVVLAVVVATVSRTGEPARRHPRIHQHEANRVPRRGLGRRRPARVV